MSAGRVTDLAISCRGFAAVGSGCTKLLLISPAAEMPASRFLLLNSAAAGLPACCWCLLGAADAFGLHVVKYVPLLARRAGCRSCCRDFMVAICCPLKLCQSRITRRDRCVWIVDAPIGITQARATPEIRCFTISGCQLLCHVGPCTTQTFPAPGDCSAVAQSCGFRVALRVYSCWHVLLVLPVLTTIGPNCCTCCCPNSKYSQSMTSRSMQSALDCYNDNTKPLYQSNRKNCVLQHWCNCVKSNQVLCALLHCCVEGIGRQRHDVTLHSPAC